MRSSRPESKHTRTPGAILPRTPSELEVRDKPDDAICVVYVVHVVERRLSRVITLTAIIFFRDPTSSQRLTAVALSSLTDTPKTQLQHWLEKPQMHEQVAVEGKTSRSFDQTKKTLEDTKSKIGANTNEC